MGERKKRRRQYERTEFGREKGDNNKRAKRGNLPETTAASRIITTTGKSHSDIRPTLTQVHAKNHPTHSVTLVIHFDNPDQENPR